ncbi:NAD-dependent epimerase/dehydratase family protein [Cohnella thailandensis]|uniref:NAD-dependent epimerase/dehydratase family protein n=1 Tax=Cohnella thailandensis TaxID=557557 RepID=A0A841SPX7_9BACL|nr:NAD-dependent epimerase/dehydratase family protein [Cohnella thailandensis]MBB6632656.1 NAD-dependent epimerase/dehydratase family protein [Cohnella thailandensis]MBP1975655.1 nucleoside-diphosphate-sugar epimerase [Cohnella thailandensis]
MRRILVTGALGQIGSELTVRLRQLYGDASVLATDIRQGLGAAAECGPYRLLDVTDSRAYVEAVREFRADAVIHLAAVLSAAAETKPLLAWDLNMGGLLNALEAARAHGCSLFAPSSIAVFGRGAPKRDTPQDAVQRPATMYGISKSAGELLCDYYRLKYGMDVRGLRFPGLVSHAAPPGGGTTDYAIDMYIQAVRTGRYSSPLARGTFLDMMYMPDAIESIVKLMEAEASRLKHRNAYNVSAMSVDPEAIASSIRRRLPNFELGYGVDPLRQSIADGWPDALDASAAREEWDFAAAYDLDRMTDDMLAHLSVKFGSGESHAVSGE